MIRSQGAEELLDVGTHVFNSGTVTINGKYSYSEERYFHHGRFHYCRVDRGQFAKVWSVISDENGAETVMPRVRQSSISHWPLILIINYHIKICDTSVSHVTFPYFFCYSYAAPWPGYPLY